MKGTGESRNGVRFGVRLNRIGCGYSNGLISLGNDNLSTHINYYYYNRLDKSVLFSVTIQRLVSSNTRKTSVR